MPTFLSAVLYLGLTQAASSVNLDSLLSGESESTQPPSAISQSESEQDIATALHFFRRGYAGYDFIDPKIIETAEKDLKATKGVTNVHQLCELIATAFSKVPDGHLGASLNQRSCTPKTIIDRHRTGSIGSNIAPKYPNQAKQPFKLIYVQQQGKRLPVLGITRFPFYESNRWSGFEQAVAEAKTNETLVIDLRGNSGGDDRRGYQLAGLLLGKAAKIETETHIERQNPETFLMFINKITHLINKQETNEEKSVYRKVKKQWQERYNKALNGKLEEYSKQLRDTHFEHEINIAPYKGSIFVLADAQCGSSCESTLKVLLTLPNLKFIGENTAGVTHFGNQGALTLPHSRIQLSMSTKFIKWANNQFIEKVGHTPDFQVKPGRDALIEVFKHL